MSSVLNSQHKTQRAPWQIQQEYDHGLVPVLDPSGTAR